MNQQQEQSQSVSSEQQLQSVPTSVTLSNSGAHLPSSAGTVLEVDNGLGTGDTLFIRLQNMSSTGETHHNICRFFSFYIFIMTN